MHTHGGKLAFFSGYSQIYLATGGEKESHGREIKYAMGLKRLEIRIRAFDILQLASLHNYLQLSMGTGG